MGKVPAPGVVGPLSTTFFEGPMLPRLPPPLPRPRIPGAWVMMASVTFVLLSGCGASSGAPVSPGPAPSQDPAAGSISAPGSEALTAAEVEAIYRSRIEAARTRFTEADVHFMTGMIHHHAQALEISRMAPERGASSIIQTLAARIINAQRDEIRIMQRWLEDRGQPVPEPHETEAGVRVHGPGHEHMHHMPGMLTDAQIRELTGTRGLDFDRLFLTLMIEHHRGAVQMVHDLFATDGAAQDEEVFRFASDVQVDQATEVARMEQMLSALPSGADAP